MAWAALWLALALLAPGAASAQQPLLTFVQISDSQPIDSVDQARFEEVLDAIAEAGQSGALLPEPVDLVLFAGDLVDDGGVPSQWVTWVQTMDSRLTAHGIPFLAVPGNHDDQGSSNFSNYESYVASSAVWDAGSGSFTGHNGITVTTNWDGLRFIGVNNDNGGSNSVSSSDRASVEALVADADAAGETVFVMGHHPHDSNSKNPLQNALGASNVLGFLHGHIGSPSISQGLAGTGNNDAWSVNTNSIWNYGALVYYEVFANEIDAYPLRLKDNPSSLPSPVTMVLAYPMQARVPPPSADFTATPTSGPAPLAVSFTDRSTGSPTSWQWTFGDGASSTQRNPSHTYTSPGTYSVTLTASNAGGSDSRTRSGYVSVTGASGGVVFTPVADARVRVGSTSNYGTQSLRVQDGGSIYNSYLRFNVQNLNEPTIASAVLRLYVTDGGTDGGSIHAVSNEWAESSINGTNAPSISGPALDSAGSVANGTWIELDVTGAVRGAGLVSFGLTNNSSNGVYYSSREGSRPPQLVVVTTGSGAPTADFAAAPRSGTLPLAVAFTDLSTGSPSSWLWDFGDGGTSNARNPSHTYASAGSYTVRLTATNSFGSNSLTRSGYISVEPPERPTADFTATPTLGPAPLAVSFSDTSSGNPTSWQWSFGDGDSSSAQNPSHVYGTPGSYTVALTASSAAGSDSLVRPGYVTVEVAPPLGIHTPVADARVRVGSTSHYPTDPLRVKDGSSVYESYLRFDLQEIGSRVSSAILRLYVTDGGPDGGSVHLVDNGWTETGIDGINAPPITGAPLDSVGPASTGTWVELDVTAGVSGPGPISFGLTNDSTTSTYYSSREGPYPPQLVVLAADPVAPTADFSASPTQGTRPLDVAFSDLSTGPPTSWLWEFGDGATSGVQNPSHTYAAAGSYTVTLTVGNDWGSDTLTRSGYVVVGAPTLPTADFTAAPTQGSAPLAVAFTDTSTGNPTSWQWSFGDGTGSSAQHPNHTYAAPGTYSVSLSVANGAGSDSVTRSGLVAVGEAAAGGTYLPIADAKVRSASPDANHGAELDLQVKDDGSKFWNSYLKFDIQAGGAVSSAVLRLYVTDPAIDGGSVYPVSNGWSELGITWNNAPPITGSPLASAGAVTAGTWVELDVTAAISGSGEISFGLASDGSNSAFYSSREGSHPPELVIQTAP